MTATRTYNSPLRAEQQEEVRQRILDKVIDVLADPSFGELSVQEVARRAGVSVRTVYRYFPDKDALYDAVNVSIRTRIGHATLPEKADDIASNIAQLFDGFGRNRDLVLAMRA